MIFVKIEDSENHALNLFGYYDFRENRDSENRTLNLFGYYDFREILGQ